MSSELQEWRLLRDLLRVEREEERKQYRERFLETPLQERVRQGSTWYPVSLESEKVGLGGRLVLELKRTQTTTQSSPFQAGSIANLFSNADPNRKVQPHVSGVVVKASADTVLLALNEEELPEWAEEGKLGLDLSYDERSYEEMDKALDFLMRAEKGRLRELREVCGGYRQPRFDEGLFVPEYPGLNASQQAALRRVAQAEDIALIHGPPGTGKTTTLIQAILHTLKTEKQVLVCAASNLAVDLLTERLDAAGVNVLRLGHPARLSEGVLRHSLDVRIQIHPSFTDVQKLRRDAEKIRGQALKFKRSFGAAQREERRLLLADARDRMREARETETYILNDLLDRAQVIACTLVGAAGDLIGRRQFSTVFMDEAAQALEPAAWIAAAKGARIVLAGDHCQLPPTVKSREAARAGLEITLFEKLIQRHPQAGVMLNVQYRMNREIMEYSNRRFYHGELQAHPSVADHLLGTAEELARPFRFIDTAGCGYEEEQGAESLSYSNPGEGAALLRFLAAVLAELPKPDPEQTSSAPSIALISPYKDQVRWLRQNFREERGLWGWVQQISADTVDGFQGQERDIVCISLVRSNDVQEIGFLADIRRMNVAMTRARKKLIVIGDSATLAGHPFYARLLEYVDECGAYMSAWEIPQD